MQLRLIEAFLGATDDLDRVGQQSQPLLRLVGITKSFGERSEKIWTEDLGSGGGCPFDPLPHFAYTCGWLPLLCQRPSLRYGVPCCIENKSLLGGKGRALRGSLVGGLRLLTKLMEPREPALGKHQA